jgi:hypothetical protein
VRGLYFYIENEGEEIMRTYKPHKHRSKEEQAPSVDTVAVIRCKNCDLWNTWDKQGELCSCAHFTLDDSSPAYTKPDDFCSYAEQQ